MNEQEVDEQRIIKAAAFGELVAKRMEETARIIIKDETIGVVEAAHFWIAVGGYYRKIYGGNDNEQLLVAGNGGRT